MGLIKYQPFEGFGNITRKMREFLDDFDNTPAAGFFGGSFSPKADISEDEKNYFIQLEAPGLSKENINIKVTDGDILVVKGEKKSEEKDESKNYLRIERSWGEFARSFRIPENADGDKIDASFKDGVLEIKIEKKEEIKPKQIEVKVK